MTGKSNAKNTQVDWEVVKKLTEIRRTYEIELEGGGIIFKLMKPSEMDAIKRDKTKMKSMKWVKVRLVGGNDKNKGQTNKIKIPKNASMGRFYN